MNFKLGILAILIMLGIGCDSPRMMIQYVHSPVSILARHQQIEVYVDSRFGLTSPNPVKKDEPNIEGDTEIIQEAIDEWNLSLNGYLRLVVVDWNFDMEPSKLVGDGLFIMQTDGTNAYTVSKRYVLGWTSEVGGNYIWVVRDRIGTGNMLRGVVLHEIGHALGSGHLGAESLMYVYDGGSGQCVDLATVKEVGKYWGFDWQNMNYCLNAHGVYKKPS
jgi:hypothetical protein